MNYTQGQIIQAQVDIDYMTDAIKEALDVKKLWIVKTGGEFKLTSEKTSGKTKDYHWWRSSVSYDTSIDLLMVRHDFLACYCALKIIDPSFILPAEIKPQPQKSWIKSIAITMGGGAIGAGTYEVISWLF